MGTYLPENIHEVYPIDGIYEYHSAARKQVDSKMTFKGHTHMGDEAIDEEFRWHTVDSQIVAGLKKAIQTS